MKISVVIPTYRRPALLARCLESVTGQTFPAREYEIIVVSDGPDEETHSVLQRFSSALPDVRFHSLSRKRGPAAARNCGWQLASGKLIVFTDDDCVPDSGWLPAMWNAYLQSDGNKLAFSGQTRVPLPAVPTDYERNIAHLEAAEFITANCACTKAALEKVGGFDEAFTMAWREDSDLQFKFLIRNIPIIKVKNARVTHPVRKAVWGISIKEEKKGIFNALLYKKFPDLYKKRIQTSPPWLYYGILALIVLFVISAFAGLTTMALLSLATWFVLTAWFTAKRLSNTSHAVSHIAEMAVTSAVIPVLSLYWRYYGAWKFKTLLIP